MWYLYVTFGFLILFVALVFILDYKNYQKKHRLPFLFIILYLWFHVIYWIVRGRIALVRGGVHPLHYSEDPFQFILALVFTFSVTICILTVWYFVETKGWKDWRDIKNQFASQDLKICPNCGAKINKLATVCLNCAESLQK